MLGKVWDYITYLLGALTLGVFAWAFNINNRVTVLETKDDSLKELITIQFEAVKSRLDRIERGMNGRLPRD